MRPDSSLIEPRFKESLAHWVESGCPTGDFLTAVLENNLRRAIEHGDDAALDNLPHIVSYIYNHCPSGCWGSPAKVREWIGLSGDEVKAWRAGRGR